MQNRKNFGDLCMRKKPLDFFGGFEHKREDVHNSIFRCFPLRLCLQYKFTQIIIRQFQILLT
jgi:hypothetical protein